VGAPGARAGVTLWSEPNFRGRSVTISEDVANLDRVRFNDQARSVQVHRGSWTLCEHSDYRGRCETFDRDVGDLQRFSLSRNISSVASEGRAPGRPGVRAAPAAAGAGALTAARRARPRSSTPGPRSAASACQTACLQAATAGRPPPTSSAATRAMAAPSTSSPSAATARPGIWATAAPPPPARCWPTCSASGDTRQPRVIAARGWSALSKLVGNRLYDKGNVNSKPRFREASHARERSRRRRTDPG
jgi:hypothetical protein